MALFLVADTVSVLLASLIFYFKNDFFHSVGGAFFHPFLNRDILEALF
jgi:hypothetical protein